MSHTTKFSYPRSNDIKRAIAAISKAGVVVGSVEISPDGALRIYAASVEPGGADNDFDEWDRRGAL